MDQGIIDGWAQLSGDFNPLHVDPEFARGTRFGGTIAHGHIALALIEGLMMQVVGESWLHGGRLENARFLSPVRPGATIEIKAQPIDGHSWTIEVQEQNSDVVCVTALATAPEAA